MAENKLADMSTEFAVKILNVTDSIKGHYSLSNQLERKSIGVKLLKKQISFLKKSPRVFCIMRFYLQNVYCLYHHRKGEC